MSSSILDEFGRRYPGDGPWLSHLALNERLLWQPWRPAPQSRIVLTDAPDAPAAPYGAQVGDVIHVRVPARFAAVARAEGGGA